MIHLKKRRNFISEKLHLPVLFFAAYLIIKPKETQIMAIKTTNITSDPAKKV